MMRGVPHGQRIMARSRAHGRPVARVGMNATVSLLTRGLLVASLNADRECEPFSHGSTLLVSLSLILSDHHTPRRIARPPARESRKPN
jgi:hypothetical protein